jgi:hypothetical protein
MVKTAAAIANTSLAKLRMFSDWTMMCGSCRWVMVGPAGTAYKHEIGLAAVVLGVLVCSPGLYITG